MDDTRLIYVYCMIHSAYYNGWHMVVHVLAVNELHWMHNVLSEYVVWMIVSFAILYTHTNYYLACKALDFLRYTKDSVYRYSYKVSKNDDYRNRGDRTDLVCPLLFLDRYK